MFEQEESTATSTDWTAQIDVLATRLMIGGIDPDCLADLRSISTEAAEAGLAEFARAALSLAAALESSSGQDVGVLLRERFAELRLALEREQRGPAALAPYSALGEDAELVADFLVEAREHLSQIEGQMLVLERDPGAIEVIHTVFRAFHTIKGLAGFLGFAVVQSVAHEVETLLDLARNERLVVDSLVVDVVLESGDFLLAEMASIDRVLAGGAAPMPADNNSLITRIRSLVTASIVRSAGLQAGQPEARGSEAPDRFAGVSNPVRSESVEMRPEETLDPTFGGLFLLDEPAGAVPAAASIPALDDVVSAVAAEGVGVAGAVPLVTVVTARVAEPLVASVRSAEPVRGSEAVKSPDASSVRVETAKLDHLMDMVGEMVIAQSLIRHSQVLLSANDSRLIGDLSQLARVTAEVQRATMSMRMVPVGQLFQRIERVIRDLSRKAGKQVTLETSGNDTEIDKTVAEELSDPLLHMVRNSVDHGIEPAAERVAAGKDPCARIRLSAYHRGGQVVIQISDDGRGLNAEKIRRKAEQKNLIAPAAALTETEIYQLIFEPGFSTAEQITDVSGRGVGMDVVRRNVEKLRGRIETQSVAGQGTTFLLKLPLTLAIIDGLVVEVGSFRYIIPLSVVREIFRPVENTLFTVEGRDEMVLVREQLLPIVRLHQRLGIECRAERPCDGMLVVIESENKCFCLLVDDLLGKQEVVIKALGETFKDASGVSGCAVLGDGRVGLILDTDGIYRGRRR